MIHNNNSSDAMKDDSTSLSATNKRPREQNNINSNNKRNHQKSIIDIDRQQLVNNRCPNTGSQQQYDHL